MSGVWIISENRRQSMELLNIGRQLADKMGTRAAALLYQDREHAQDCVSHGADEVMLLPRLSSEQPAESCIPVIVEEVKKRRPRSDPPFRHAAREKYGGPACGTTECRSREQLHPNRL